MKPKVLQLFFLFDIVFNRQMLAGFQISNIFVALITLINKWYYVRTE